MSYSQAHLSELGLSLWRRRGDAAAVAEPAPVPGLSRPDPDALGAPPRAAVREAAPAQPALERSQPAVEPVVSDAELAARETRIMGMDWEALEAYVREQSRGAAKQAVFGVGARDADVMIVGEAPGAEEDARGEPFVGPAGQLLDQMLRAIGLSRQRDVYIANICKFRPPNNRDPLPEEVAEDMPYLRRQIQLVAPKVLVAVGRIAAQNLLQRSDPIGRMRGQEFQDADSGLPVIVTYHPAYLLRSPREKAKAWQDLKRVRAVLLAG